MNDDSNSDNADTLTDSGSNPGRQHPAAIAGGNQQSPNHRSFHTFEFTGNTREFFRIWIVNVMLTVVTLGIYSAWAKVRTKQYFYGNTFLDGSAFAYTANPVNILKGRAIAVLLLVAYGVAGNFSPTAGGLMLLVGVLLLPCIVVLSLSFRMRYSNWRGINFGFRRDFLRAYLLFSPLIIYIALSVLLPQILGINEEMQKLEQSGDQGAEAAPVSGSLIMYLQLLGGLILLAAVLFPWWQKMFYSFVANRTYFGSTPFRFIALTIEFYGIYLSAILVFVGGLVAIALLFGILTAIFGEGIMALIGLLILLPYAMAASLIQTQRTNTIFSNLELNEITFSSELKVNHMMYLYVTNTLAILFTLGLAIPWAKIRIARYRAETMRLFAADFAAFTANRFHDENALGDGATDVFDIDIGF